jgi:alpha-glucosidase
VVDEYDGAVLLAEPTDFENTTPYYGDGTDMFHMTFNFAYGYFWSFHFGSKKANNIAASFDRALNDHPPEAQEALVIGSHDVPRAFNAALGGEGLQRRAAVVQMAMRGTPFIYYGEEVALRPGTDQVVDTRDSARTPLPWTAESPGFGFTEGSEPWLAFSPESESTNVATQAEDPSSIYGFYRAMLGLRRGRAVWGSGEVTILTGDNEAVLTFLRDDGDLTYLVVVNLSDEAQTVTLPDADLPNIGLPVLGSVEVTLDGAAATLAIDGGGYAILRHR